MTLREYVHKNGGTETLQRISDDSGVSMVTLRHVMSGMKLKLYEKAKAVSDATRGKVSVAELCE